MSLSRSRSIAGAALAAVAALALAACSAGTAETPSASPTSSPTASPAAAAFPVTVTHAYGDVTIEAAPERIVTLGSREHELLYSLGVAPVAVPENWQGYPYGTGPWAEEARIAVGAEPETFATAELNVEQIAAFAPDLIIATYPTQAITEDLYAQLSQIAPTIVRGEGFDEWGMPLADELRLVGAAVGKSAEAEAVIEDIDAQFAAVREAHPDWEGKTGVVGFHYDGNPGVYYSTDNRNQFLANLGLKVDALDSYVNDQFYISISAEQLDLLDLDTVIWQAATTPEVQETIESLPLFPSTGVTKKGGNIWIKETILEGAFFANSPLSITYTLNALVPGLEAALDGDTATEVPVFTDAG